MSPVYPRSSVKCPSPAGGPRAPVGRDCRSHAMTPRFLCRARRRYDTVSLLRAGCSLQWGSCRKGESTLRTRWVRNQIKGAELHSQLCSPVRGHHVPWTTVLPPGMKGLHSMVCKALIVGVCEIKLAVNREAGGRDEGAGKPTGPCQVIRRICPGADWLMGLRVMCLNRERFLFCGVFDLSQCIGGARCHPCPHPFPLVLANSVTWVGGQAPSPLRKPLLSGPGGFPP